LGERGDQLWSIDSLGNIIFDAQDENPNCGNNLWAGISAINFSPPCIVPNG